MDRDKVRELFDNLPNSLSNFGSVDPSVAEFETLDEALEDLKKQPKRIEDPNCLFRKLKYIG